MSSFFTKQSLGNCICVTILFLYGLQNVGNSEYFPEYWKWFWGLMPLLEIFEIVCKNVLQVIQSAPSTSAAFPWGADNDSYWRHCWAGWTSDKFHVPVSLTASKAWGSLCSLEELNTEESLSSSWFVQHFPSRGADPCAITTVCKLLFVEALEIMNRSQ